MSRAKRLAVVLSFSGQGGVERMVTHLLRGFADLGVAVDLLALGDPAAVPGSLPDSVRRVETGVRHSTLAAPALARYLRRERPAAMLVAKDRAIRSAALARRLAGADTRLVGRLGTNLSAALRGQGPAKRWLRMMPMRRLYPWVDAVVAVSEGVAEDTRRITGLPPERVVVVRNPVITPQLSQRAREPVDHPWLAPGAPPVVMGMGRLTRQKDFPTLLRAFARLARDRDCRLVMLGEGNDRPALEALAADLGIAERLALVGHQANPYAWLARASLFVLSSAWEGSPNALTEALALGIPGVATDCPSGPREILDGGRVAPLVPVGDWQALARAMAGTLEAPPPPDALRAAVAEYTQEASARAYLRVLGLGEGKEGLRTGD